MWNETGAPRREGMTRSIRSLAAAMSPSCVAAVSTAWNTPSMLSAASVSKRARATLVKVIEPIGYVHIEISVRPDSPLQPAHVRQGLPRERDRAPAHQARHPWTNGQAERMNRTIKDAT